MLPKYKDPCAYFTFLYTRYIPYCYTICVKNSKKCPKNDVFWWFSAFLGVFWGADPKIMGTIQTGSVSAIQKGLTHFCSSNGLVSVTD